MSRRISAIAAITVSIVLFSAPPAGADHEEEECGQLTCEQTPTPTAQGDDEGTVVVVAPGDDGSPGDGVPVDDPNDGCPDPGSVPSGNGTCSGGTDIGGGNDPPCVDADGDGNWDEEPCAAPGAPCIGFVVGDPDPNTCGPQVPPRPVFTPPTAGEAAQEALDQVVWPTIDPATSDFGEGLVYGGFEYSLSLGGYEAWEPLVATATITQTIVVQGYVFTEDFTATLTATPREVLWDTGPINDTPTRHNPPREVVCDGPGDPTWLGDGKFKNYEAYNSYGGPDCLFVWWNNSASIGGLQFFMQAEVVWDLTLETSWAGDMGSVGEHTETYGAAGLDAHLSYAVNVNEGSETTQELNGG